MRNLIAFLQRFRIFLVFLLLQIIALTSYFSIVNYPRTKWFNSSASFFASLLSINHQVTKHFDLEIENRVLQNALKKAYKESINTYIPVKTNQIKVNDTLLQLQYNYVPATIKNGTYTRKDNFFTIDKGRKADIKADMGVVSSNGLVGIVYDVSDYYAVVKSILHSSINIPVQVEKINAKGLLKWEIYDNNPLRIKLTGISNDIPIPRGSNVVTTGSSGLFPPNYSVGKVETVKPIEGKPEWEITVRLSNDLRTTQNVFVIENILKTEQHELEEKAKQEFKEE
jgi:rod shape-determining protein MreC